MANYLGRRNKTLVIVRKAYPAYSVAAMSSLLADLILVVHFAFVLFIALGLASIWLGAACAWQWVRNLRFRLAHLCAIGFVAAEALAGFACPLTVWEDTLRAAGASGSSFIGRWVGRLLYYDFPEAVFTALYVACALAVAASYVLIPPRPRARCLPRR